MLLPRGNHTSRATSAFIAAMASSTITSGHAERHSKAVMIPAPMMPMFASASFHAERKVAFARLPPCRFVGG